MCLKLHISYDRPLIATIGNQGQPVMEFQSSEVIFHLYSVKRGGAVWKQCEIEADP